MFAPYTRLKDMEECNPVIFNHYLLYNISKEYKQINRYACGCRFYGYINNTDVNIKPSMEIFDHNVKVLRLFTKVQSILLPYTQSGKLIIGGDFYGYAFTKANDNSHHLF